MFLLNEHNKMQKQREIKNRTKNCTTLPRSMMNNQQPGQPQPTFIGTYWWYRMWHVIAEFFQCPYRSGTYIYIFLLKYHTIFNICSRNFERPKQPLHTNMHISDEDIERRAIYGGKCAAHVCADLTHFISDSRVWRREREREKEICVIG